MEADLCSNSLKWVSFTDEETKARSWPAQVTQLIPITANIYWVPSAKCFNPFNPHTVSWGRWKLSMRGEMTSSRSPSYLLLCVSSTADSALGTCPQTSWSKWYLIILLVSCKPESMGGSHREADPNLTKISLSTCLTLARVIWKTVKPGCWSKDSHFLCRLERPGWDWRSSFLCRLVSVFSPRRPDGRVQAIKAHPLCLRRLLVYWQGGWAGHIQGQAGRKAIASGSSAGSLMPERSKV